MTVVLAESLRQQLQGQKLVGGAIDLQTQLLELLRDTIETQLQQHACVDLMEELWRRMSSEVHLHVEMCEQLKVCAA